MSLNVVMLAGGVGGAKLADGLAQILPVGNLTIIGNTGDDFVHCGLTICPDLDTVMHTLTDLANTETGWGRAGESWRTMEAVRVLDGPDWFNLGDIDLGTHLVRSHRLAQGDSLTATTAALTTKLGTAVPILPMSDQAAPTLIRTAAGDLPFQTWFVKHRWQPVAERIVLPEKIPATPQVVSALQAADLVIIAPSNPYVSIDPILNCHPVRTLLTEQTVVAVTPIIAGDVVKGPAAKMMRDWGLTVSAQTIADFYGTLLDGFVFDERDKDCVISNSFQVHSTDTLMGDRAGRKQLAQTVIKFALEQLI